MKSAEVDVWAMAPTSARSAPCATRQRTGAAARRAGRTGSRPRRGRSSGRGPRARPSLAVAPSAVAMNEMTQGMKVMSSDGATLGKIIRVEPGFFLVEKGFFFPKDYSIPISLVREIRDDACWLSVSREELEREDESLRTRYAGTEARGTIGTGERDLAEGEQRLPLSEEELEAPARRATTKSRNAERRGPRPVTGRGSPAGRRWELPRSRAACGLPMAAPARAARRAGRASPRRRSARRLGRRLACRRPSSVAGRSSPSA